MDSIFQILKETLVFFKKFGIEVKFVPSDDPADFAKAIDEKTKAIYVESIGNPKYNVAPIPEIAKVCEPLFFVIDTKHFYLQVAHDNKIPLIVDNTFGCGGKLGYVAVHCVSITQSPRISYPPNRARG